MHRFPGVIRLFAVMLLLLAGLTACKGQRAQLALRKTNEMKAQIESLNGTKHAPDKLKGIVDLVNAANQQLATDANTAYTTAKQAQQMAEQALQEVTAAEAQDLWNQAEEEIRVADTNAGNRIDPNRYQKILDLRTKAGDARAKNDFETLITRSREIRQEVTTLLSGLKTNADRKRIQSEQKLTDLKSIGGPIYCPETVIAVQDAINGAVKTSESARDYVLASNQFGNAISLAEKGIEEVKRAQSKEKIDEIEKRLAEALGEGARELVAEEYNRVVDLHEKLVADYEQRRFDRVLLSAEDLRPRAQALVISTKRKKSDERLRAMERDIDTLVEGGAREYLPGRVEVLERMVADARDIRKNDTEEAFDRIKVISQDAADEADKVNRAFSDLATESIRVAGTELDNADAIFEQSGSIFDPIEPGQVTPEQKAFESAKETRRNDLKARLRQSREDLLVSDQRQQAKKYKAAILLADEQAKRAKEVTNEVFHVVAHNASIELANLVSRYERDGAREYAADELKRSVADLEEVKKLVDGAQYRDATNRASAARANVELMAQRISGRAVDNLREARAAAKDATSVRTQKYQGEKLAQVQQLIAEAEQDLQGQRLKLAVENAQRAIELSTQAKTEASRLAAQDGIAEAERKIDRAGSAGAANYAGRELEDAKKLLQSAKGLMASEDYDKAEDLAMSSVSRADQAFYKKVNDAEAAIADAKAVGGWEYDSGSLGKSSAQVIEAKTQLESGSYSQSASLADSSRSTARGVADASKNNNFRRAVGRIDENLETGRRQGIDYFQADESIAVRRRVLELENGYTLDKYDYTIAELEKLEGKLRTTLDSTKQVVTTVADQQEARLDKLVESGAADYAGDLVPQTRSALKYSRVDYKNGRYKSAHSNLATAIKNVNEMESRSFEVAYVRQMRDIHQRYIALQKKFGHVLSLTPTELRSIATGIQGQGHFVSLSSQISPNQFREGVDRLYSEGLAVAPPPRLRKVHESVIAALNEARLGALHFEKLVILNEIPRAQVGEVVNEAYRHINESNAIIGRLQRDFFSDEVRFKVVQAASQVMTTDEEHAMLNAATTSH